MPAPPNLLYASKPNASAEPRPQRRQATGWPYALRRNEQVARQGLLSVLASSATHGLCTGGGSHPRKAGL